MATVKVKTETAGNIWKIVVKVGDMVATDQVMVILESMKMEIPITAPCSGRVTELLVTENTPVSDDEVIATIESD